MQKKRQTEKEVGRQHSGVDRLDTERLIEKHGKSRGMEEAGCSVSCGAPTVYQTTGQMMMIMMMMNIKLLK